MMLRAESGKIDMVHKSDALWLKELAILDAAELAAEKSEELGLIPRSRRVKPKAPDGEPPLLHEFGKDGKTKLGHHKRFSHNRIQISKVYTQEVGMGPSDGLDMGNIFKDMGGHGASPKRKRGLGMR